MSWDRPVKLNDNLGFCLDSGSFGNLFMQDEYFNGERVCIPIRHFLEMSSKDIKDIKAWLKKYAPEMTAIQYARECNWDKQFLDVDDLLLIINGTFATDEEKGMAKECLKK